MLLSSSVLLLAAVAGMFSLLAARVAQAKRATRKPNCYYCGNPAMHPSTPGLADPLLAHWNCMPYRCEICSRRQYRLAGARQEDEQ